jgi:hypothetical protein
MAKARDAEMRTEHCAGKRWLRTIVGLSACGAALAVSCGPKELRAVVAGIEAVAGSLDRTNRDAEEDVSFGEWLLSEFDD